MREAAVTAYEAVCPECAGSGIEPVRPDDPEYECARCDGTGFVDEVVNALRDEISERLRGKPRSITSEGEAT
jgi:DnaJ-class molecular chaperone